MASLIPKALNVRPKSSPNEHLFKSNKLEIINQIELTSFER